MAKMKSIKVNFIMNCILSISTVVFPLISFRYVSEILLAGGVGKVNFATSVAQYFSMVAMLGVPTYGIRACAQVRDDRRELTKTVQEILFLNLLVSVFTYAVYFLAIWKVPKMHADVPLYLVMGATIIFNVIGVEWLYKGLEQYTYITVRSIIFKALALVLMFVCVKTEGDYVIYGAISIFAAVGSNIMNFLNLRKVVDIRPTGGYNLRRHLKPVLIFFLMSVATTIYTNLDTVMLGFMQGDVQTGYYTAAVKVKGILVNLVTALSAVLLPRVSYYIEHHMDKEFDRVGRKALNFVSIVSVPVVVYFILYAKETIFLLSTESFAPAIPAMQVIMPTVLFIGLTNVLGIQILVPLNKEKLVCISVFIGAVVDFVINLLCIPKMAAVGAAFGTLVAEIVVLFVQMGMMRGEIRRLMEDIRPLKILLAVVAAAAASCWVKALQFPDLLALMVSAVLFFAVYGGILLVAREALTKEIFEMVLKKLHIKKGSA